MDRCTVTVQPAGPVGKRRVFLTVAFEDDNQPRQIDLVLSECAANRLGQALFSGSFGFGRDVYLAHGPD